MILDVVDKYDEYSTSITILILCFRYDERLAKLEVRYTMTFDMAAC